MKYRIILIVFAILLFIVVDFFAKNQNEEKYRKFYDNTINGRITDLIYHKGAVDIVVRGDRYMFIPEFTNNETEFRFFAKKGDSVFKAARSFKLSLVHGGKTYLYQYVKL